MSKNCVVWYRILISFCLFSQGGDFAQFCIKRISGYLALGLNAYLDQLTVSEALGGRGWLFASLSSERPR